MKMLKMTPNMKKWLETTTSMLEDEITDLQEVIDARSEEWRESDEGAEFEAWIERLGNLVDEIESITDALILK